MDNLQNTYGLFDLSLPIKCTYHHEFSSKNKLEKTNLRLFVLSDASMPQSDDLTASRPHVSREEQELRDVEMEMESQLNTQHMQVRDGGHK